MRCCCSRCCCFLLFPSLASSFSPFPDSGFFSPKSRHLDFGPSTFRLLLSLGLLLLKASCVLCCASSHFLGLLLFTLTIHLGFPTNFILTPSTSVNRLIIFGTLRGCSSSSGETSGRPHGGSSSRRGCRASHKYILNGLTH